jgi:hypothetical protein
VAQLKQLICSLEKSVVKESKKSSKEIQAENLKLNSQNSLIKINA